METNHPDCVILTDEELAEVTAGIGGMVGSIVRICEDLGLDVTPSFVSGLILQGGCAMRNWAKSRTGNDPDCNRIPCF